MHNEQQLITNKIQLQADHVIASITHETCAFLQRSNQLTQTHKEFIRHLASYYIYNYYGIKQERLVVTAPTGLGKTTTLRFFLRMVLKLIGWNSSATKGILVCSNQIEELEQHYLWLREEMGYRSLDGLVALHHSKPANRETAGAHVPVTPLDELEDIPIVLATQAMIRRQRDGTKSVKQRTKLNDLVYYQDRVRMLCWDEEAIATKASHIQVSSLERFSRDLEEMLVRFNGPDSGPKGARQQAYNNDTEVMLQFLEHVVQPVIKAANAAPPSEAINIPVPKLDGDTSQRQVETILRGRYFQKRIAPVYLEAGLNLATWAGSTACVHYRYDPMGPGTVMDFVVELPSDITEAVITDASAAVNKLIKLDPTLRIPTWMQDHAHDLKRYDHLQLLTMACGGGRHSFLTASGEISKRWQGHIKKVVAIVEEKLPNPKDKILVVTFRGEHDKELHVNQIKKILKAEGFDLTRYSFITYGFHRATNDYSHAKAVLLFGTYHLDQGMLLSSARSQTRDPLRNDLQEFTLQQLADSQAAADIQQAFGRGCCRQAAVDMDGQTQGKPMLAFVALSCQEFYGVLMHLETAFPGVKIDSLTRPAESPRSRAIKVGLGILKRLPEETAKLKLTELQQLIQAQMPEHVFGVSSIRAISTAIATKAAADEFLPWERSGHYIRRGEVSSW